MSASKSQPTTPIRNVNRDSQIDLTSFLSQPSTSQRNAAFSSSNRFAHLPPKNKINGLSNSVPITPNNRTRHGHSNKRVSLNKQSTPHSTRRSRRSSIIITADGDTIYDYNYQGPITIDYLRFFCKVQIKSEAKQQQREEKLRNIEVQSQENELKLNRISHYDDAEENVFNAPARDDFNQSFNIPSNYKELLDFPELNKSSSLLQASLLSPVSKYQIDSNYKDSPIVNQTKEVSAKPKPISYLQKLLLAKSGKTISEKSDSDSPESSSRGTNSKDFNIQESKVRSNDKLHIGFEPDLMDIDPQLIDNQRHQEQMHDRSHSPDLEAPSQDKQASDKDLPPRVDELTRSPSSSSDADFIQEEFTIDEQLADTSIFNHEQDIGSPNPNSKQKNFRLLSQNESLRKKRKTTTKLVGNPINLNDMASLVRSIQSHMNINGQKGTKKLSMDLLRSIQSKSDTFLTNVMDDLANYAKHRESNEIDIQDVLLLLKRIKFARKIDDSNEIDRISELAQKFLPLECLITLDNELSTIAK